MTTAHFTIEELWMLRDSLIVYNAILDREQAYLRTDLLPLLDKVEQLLMIANELSIQSDNHLQ